MASESSVAPTPGLLKSRLQLIALAAVFFGPFLYAAWLFYGSDWQPGESTNHGELVDPPIALPNLAIATPDGRVEGALRALWTLLYIERGPCTERCRETLVQIRQIRLAAGRDVDRIRRLYVGTTLPDADWLAAGHAGLIATEFNRDADLAGAIAELETGIYLIDPVGQVMMRYGVDVESKPVYDDLHRLLKITR